jgi:hypothetical protein
MSMSLQSLFNFSFTGWVRELSRTQKALSDLRARWGSAGDKRGLFVSDYFDLTRDQGDRAVVDDQTWADLEFPEIFSRLDTTVTPIGSQVLFKQMRTLVADSESLKAHYEVCDRLRSDSALRESIQLKMLSMEPDENAFVADLLFGDPPEKMRRQGLIPWWGLASVLTLLAVIFGPVPFWIWLVFPVVNILVIKHMAWNLFRDTANVERSLRMLRLADALGSIRPSGAPLAALQRLDEEQPVRAKARGAMRWLSYLQRPPVDWVAIWLTFAFLLKPIAYLRTMRGFVRVRPQLAATFQQVGALDAAIATANFLQRCPHHCQPVFSERRVLEIEHGYHPLIDDPVKNSVRLEVQSALVTGSNMAGKTTFIKTLGVNMIFGQTLGFCLAESATLPRSPVMASIVGRHSVASGKSHYFAEVERIHEFLDQARAGACKVFLIDEPFSGTNTTERLAVCRAVLETLGADATVLVTTHDVELQALLAGQYRLFHFQENPDVDGFFDYRLREGAATERNAIRLLQRIGFPQRGTEHALAYVGRVQPDSA